MKIGIFTQWDDPFYKVAQHTMPFLREYAARHSYDLHESVNPKVERSIIWDRYKILSEYIEKYDWVVHVDADVLITNMHIRLEEFTRGDYAEVIVTMPICEDGLMRMNDGVTFFKSEDWMKNTLLEIFNAPATEEIQCGQDALNRMWRSGKFPGDIAIERHKAMNSFLYREYGMLETTIGQWTPGDFVLHLPGISNHRRVELLEQYIPQILR